MLLGGEGSRSRKGSLKWQSLVYGQRYERNLYIIKLEG
jgi:hypothetical protein